MNLPAAQTNQQLSTLTFDPELTPGARNAVNVWDPPSALAPAGPQEPGPMLKEQSWPRCGLSASAVRAASPSLM